MTRAGLENDVVAARSTAAIRFTPGFTWTHALQGVQPLAFSGFAFPIRLSTGSMPARNTLIGCVASLVVPTLASRQPSQSGWVVGCALTSAFSLIGILCLPTALVGVAVLTLGLGLNASFGLALLLIAVRSHDTDTSASLSSMAQAGGYLLAAPGPLLIGWFQTLTDSWTNSFGAIVILALMTASFGYFAGRGGTLCLSDREASTAALGISAPGRDGED